MSNAIELDEKIKELTEKIILDPENAELYFDQGLCYHNLEDYESALNNYTKAIELDPENAKLYFGRGCCYWILEDYESALNNFTKAIEFDPENKNTYLYRGVLYFELKKYEAALKDFTKAIELNPENENTYLYRGGLYFELKKYEAALKDFTKAIELNPENESAYLERGRFYLILEDNDSALKDFTKAIEINPENESAYYFRSASYLNMKNINDIKIYCGQPLYKIVEGPVYSSMKYYSKFLYKIFESPDYDSALKDLTKAIELNPENDSAYMFRGFVYGVTEDYDSAIKDLTKAIELNPENDSAYRARVLFYGAIEDYDSAIEDLTKAIELRPEIADGYALRGALYCYDLRRYNDALKDLTKVIEFNPENDNEINVFEIFRADLFYTRGCCYLNLQNYDAALKDFTKAIELYPEYCGAFCWRGACYFYLQNYKAALNDCTKSIEYDSSFPFPYLYRSRCYYKMEKYEDSLKDLSSYKKTYEKFRKKIKEDEIKSSDILADLVIASSIDYMLKAMEILLDLKKLKFYNKKYPETAKYFDALNFENEKCSSDIESFIFQLFKNYPKFNHSLSEVLERDGKELFLIRSKLSILADICDRFNEEISKLGKDTLSENAEKHFNQQANFMFLYFHINKALQEKSVELVEQKEREKAQAKIEERNKIINDLSHSIKNLISTVIDPLENLKHEIAAKSQVIENALRGANLVREIVNAMNLSFKGTIDDFYHDAKNNTAKDSISLQSVMIESLKYSVGNMFDSKYFNDFMRQYFPKKEFYLAAKSEWVAISQSDNLDDFYSFLKKYFFETDFLFNDAEKFVMGNEKGSSVKLLILFQEIILNAVKYSAFINREKRFLQIRIANDTHQISVKVENPFEPGIITKTTAIGHVIIENFAKLLNTEPVINNDENIYSLEIRFPNFWSNDA